MEINLFEKYFDLKLKEVEKKTFKNERDELVNQIVDILNEERKDTIYKPMTKASVAVMLNKKYGNNNFPVYQLISICRDNKNRNKTFGKYFFWKIKN